MDNEGKSTKIDIPFLPVPPKMRNEYRKIIKENLKEAKKLDDKWEALLSQAPNNDPVKFLGLQSDYKEEAFELSNEYNIEILKEALNFHGVDKALLNQIRKPNDEWWQNVDSHSIAESVASFRKAYNF